MGVLGSASARRLDGSAPTWEGCSQHGKGENSDERRRGRGDGSSNVGGLQTGFRGCERCATRLEHGSPARGVESTEDSDSDGPADLRRRRREAGADARVLGGDAFGDDEGRRA